MLAVFAAPVGASPGAGALQDTLLNAVYENVKGSAETSDMFIAGKKTKGGTRRVLPKIKGSCRETHEMLMAGKKKKPGTSGRRRYISGSIDKAQELFIAGTDPIEVNFGRIKRPWSIRIFGSLNETHQQMIAGLSHMQSSGVWDILAHFNHM